MWHLFVCRPAATSKTKAVHIEKSLIIVIQNFLTTGEKRYIKHFHVNRMCGNCTPFALTSSTYNNMDGNSSGVLDSPDGGDPFDEGLSEASSLLSKSSGTADISTAEDNVWEIDKGEKWKERPPEINANEKSEFDKETNHVGGEAEDEDPLAEVQ